MRHSSVNIGLELNVHTFSRSKDRKISKVVSSTSPLTKFSALQKKYKQKSNKSSDIFIKSARLRFSMIFQGDLRTLS